MSIETFGTLGDAISLAQFAHRNQRDKAGQPYILHPLWVMNEVKRRGGSERAQKIAILHDVTEDTAVTPEILRALGFSDDIVDAVVLLDRGRSKIACLQKSLSLPIGKFTLTEKEFYYSEIANDPDAKLVKNVDMDHNSSPERLDHLDEKTQARLVKKYTEGRLLLNATV